MADRPDLLGTEAVRAPIVIPMPQDGKERILWLIVATLLPLAIEEIAHRGGPTEADFERSRAAGFDLASSGDALQFGGRTAAERRVGSGAIARALAPLAWSPGGVVVAGELWKMG